MLNGVHASLFSDRNYYVISLLASLAEIAMFRVNKFVSGTRKR
jgi:hypothetical protein